MAIWLGRTHRSVGRLVSLVKVKKGLDVRPVSETSLPLHLLKLAGLVVAPAALGQKGIEDQNLLIVRPPTVRKAPLQNLIVRRAGQDPLDNRGVFDVQKSANPPISARA